MSRDSVWECGVLLHPSKEAREKGERARFVVDIKTLIASSQEEATMRISREVTEDVVEAHGDRLQIVVRPF